MITIVFWGTIAIFSMLLLGVLPGVKEVFRPIMDILSKGLVEVIKFAAGYILWLIKTIIHAHLDFISHLSHSRSYFDPSDNIKK
tara:strand:- start:388 stop:639 length:252 start_codon:yes stop_codon:yes gene_type:complete